jgi:hypothetical protein
MKWNSEKIRSLKNEFETAYYGLHGQHEAVDHLIELLEENYIYKKHTLIFLLGGPGVGIEKVCRDMDHVVLCSCNGACKAKTRHLAIPIENDATSEFYNRSLCKSLYRKGRSITFAVDYIYNFKQAIHEVNDQNFANFYKADHQYLKELNLNFVHIVTGSIMSDEDLKSFENAKEYENYVAKVAIKLESYMKEHAPEIKYHIITFKPLSKEQVMKNHFFLNGTEGYQGKNWEIYEKYIRITDFVPHGDKIYDYSCKKLFKTENTASEWNYKNFI